MISKHAESFIVIGSITLCTILILFPEVSLAGTGGEELQGVYDKTIAVATGYGGKTAAALAFLGSLIMAVKGNIYSFISAFAVGVLASVGPSMVTSGISALI